jgi:hypothetical protein
MLLYLNLLFAHLCRVSAVFNNFFDGLQRLHEDVEKELRPPDQGGEPIKSRRNQLWNEKEHLARAIDQAKTVSVCVVAESRYSCQVA